MAQFCGSFCFGTCAFRFLPFLQAFFIEFVPFNDYITAIMRDNSNLEIIPLETVTKLVSEIEKEKAEEAEIKKQQRAASKAARED